jgi:hypothetical protein
MDWTWYLSFKGRINQSGCTIAQKRLVDLRPFLSRPVSPRICRIDLLP